MRLATFWHSGPLRNIEALCLTSWVALGFEVDLYHYGAVSNVPAGVATHDAAEILDQRLLQKLTPLLHKERAAWQPIVNFSNFIRMKLMENALGLWLDADTFLFRRFEVAPDRPFFAWENARRIGSPVFYVPPDSPMVKDYIRVFESDTLMPHWLGWRRRVLKPLIWRMQGKEFSPPDLGITIYGNDAFTRLAKKHGLARYALDKRSFYFWNGSDTLKFYDPAYGEWLWDDPTVLGFHVHRKGPSSRRPDPRSLYGRALDRLAAHLPPLDWEA